MSTTIAAAATGQCMATRGKEVGTTGAAIAVRRGACTADVEAMRDVGLAGKQPAHHRLPLTAMGPCTRPVVEVLDQPVGHLVGHHLGQEGLAVLGVEARVEAQPAAAEVGLAGTLAAQVAPHPRPRQVGVNLATALPGGLDLSLQAGLELCGIEALEMVARGNGER